MDAHRFRAPSEDGGLLAIPPLAEAPAWLEANRQRLAAWDYNFHGRRAGRLRAMARPQVLDAARAEHRQRGLEPLPPLDPAAPLLATGHQPELFHPGVWAKNFAAAALARPQGGLALNLIVDNDVPRSPSIRVPTPTDSGLRVVQVEFDRWSADVPYEAWTVRDEELFASFPDRVRAVLAGMVPDPVLDEFWPHVAEAARHTDRIGTRFAVARRRLEAAWGIHNAEVPISRVCQTEAFLWFAASLLADLPRFREIHNAALRRYRAAYGIRSSHHPVADLAGQADWNEAPFWVWRAGAPRRRPLLARQAGRVLQLRIATEEAPFIELPLTPGGEACCAVEALRDLPARGIAVRTRALTTTMFARLLVGDLFFHGIGGAKYDELGDVIIRDYYGLEPPGYGVLSMTLWLGLPDDPATPERLHRLERLRRELIYNPERHLPPDLPADLAAALAAKRAAIAGPVATHRQRVARFEAIRAANAVLAAPLEPRRAAVEAELARTAAGLAANTVAHGRDYPFIIHSRTRLRAALAAIGFAPKMRDG